MKVEQIDPRPPVKPAPSNSRLARAKPVLWPPSDIGRSACGLRACKRYSIRALDAGVRVIYKIACLCSLSYGRSSKWSNDNRPPGGVDLYGRLSDISGSERFGGTMANPQMVMYEEEFNQIQTVVDRLVKEANAKVVFIVDKNGQLIAASGDIENIDTTSLASLTAGNIAATGGIAKLLRENEFATQFHEGEKANIHIQLVGNRVILVVIFDSKSSLGLVRLRVRKASDELNRIFELLLSKVPEPGSDSPFAEITDEDIDNLFND